MQSNLKKIKIELGDELLHFAVANAEKIDALKKYRGKCEPTWLFFGSGHLVGVIKGANAQFLQKQIVEKLQAEHSVLKGEAERIVICDPTMSVETEKEQEQTAKEEKEKEVDDEEDEIVEGMNEIRRRSRAKINQSTEKDLQTGMMNELTLPRPVTVAIIKPDVVGDDIIREIQNSGFEIVQQEHRKLCQEEVEKLYGSCLTTEDFEELLTFMTSKECHLLLLAKEGNVISEWIEKMGPEKVNLAKETAPDSLRAQYGTDDIRNAVYGSADEHAVLREVALLFPNFLNRQELAEDSSNEVTQDERQMSTEGITTKPYEGDGKQMCSMKNQTKATKQKKKTFEKFSDKEPLTQIQKDMELEKNQGFNRSNRSLSEDKSEEKLHPLSNKGGKNRRLSLTGQNAVSSTKPKEYKNIKRWFSLTSHKGFTKPSNC
ncbi:thioredoxin domain-containing protein 6-like isoform X2 [Tachypleus tridentatus]